MGGTGPLTINDFVKITRIGGVSGLQIGLLHGALCNAEGGRQGSAIIKSKPKPRIFARYRAKYGHPSTQSCANADGCFLLFGCQ